MLYTPEFCVMEDGVNELIYAAQERSLCFSIMVNMLLQTSGTGMMYTWLGVMRMICAIAACLVDS